MNSNASTRDRPTGAIPHAAIKRNTKPEPRRLSGSREAVCLPHIASMDRGAPNKVDIRALPSEVRD